MLDWLIFFFMFHWSIPVLFAAGLVLIFLLVWREVREDTDRTERGACPKCGYDLLGDYKKGCTECGWARERRP